MIEPATLPECALTAARRWPERLAVIDGARSSTFAELANAMGAAAKGIAAKGLRPGERVAIWAPNSLDWIVACLGVQMAGGVIVPLNTRFRSVEAGDILRRSGARLLLVSDGFLGRTFSDEIAGEDLPQLGAVIPLAELGHGSVGLSQSLATPDDPADILFTSGTTGAPKGVVATHRQTIASARSWAQAVGLRTDDRFAILWPFFHCSGYKAGWLAALICGAAVLPLATYRTETLLQLVREAGVTVLPGPPTLFHDLLADTSRSAAALVGVRLSVTGAASVAPELIRAMREDLDIATVLTGYGLTETCGTVSMSLPDDPPDLVARSCGRAVPGMTIRIVDDRRQELPANAVGDIEVRGPEVMRGYLDDPAATDEVLGPDGWLRTGDVGTLDPRGYLTITDRRKHMFVSGGFNCYPAEIERLLSRHPAVSQAAVIGVPDARLGEVGAAFVVLNPGAVLAEEELIGWSRGVMAGFKVPRRITFVTELPLNATGKVDKRLLAA